MADQLLGQVIGTVTATSSNTSRRTLVRDVYVDEGGVGGDPSLGGEFEIQDPRGVAPVMYAPYLTFSGPDGAALGESQRLTPQAGMFVVFPSWLRTASARIADARADLDAVNFSLGGG